jgi:hypothetical protein
MKLIIAGSRNFSDYELLRSTCNEELKNITEIVSGTANGADKLGEKYALENNIKIKRFPADWNKYGKSAGYLRNAEMAKYGDSLIAFWDGKSRGTEHMINLAKKQGIKIKVVHF